MTVHHAARFDDAIHALCWILGWAGGFMEVQSWNDRRGWHSDVFDMDDWAGTSPGSRVATFVQHQDEKFSSEMRLGVPAGRPRGGVRTATAFWVRVEGAEQNRWLTGFRPEPTIVLREGASSRRWALWSLEHPVKWKGVDRGNRMLAHRMRAPKKHAEPERLWLPAPGCCLRKDRARPVPVVVERLEAVSFRPLDVVGKRMVDGRRYPALPDAPDPEAWMKSQTDRRVP